MPSAATAAKSSDTAERILAAALDAFSEEGFDGARTRDIAARAGITLGLVQYHFGSKDDLWKAAVDRAFGVMEAKLDQTLAREQTLDERALLRELIHGHVEFVAEHTAFIRIMHDEGKRRGTRMRWLVDRYVRPLYEKVTPILERAQATGVLLAEVDPIHLFYVFVGSTGMIFHQAEECKRLSGIDPTAPDAVRAHVRTLESLFLRPTPTELST